jgi:hypothetical protein
MKFFVRTYQGDIPLVLRSIGHGARFAGIVVDAPMHCMARGAYDDLRQHIPHDQEVLLDPVTHKIQNPLFRGMATAYQRLPYFMVPQWGTSEPELSKLHGNGASIAQDVASVQRKFNVTSFLTPSLFVEPDSFPSHDALTNFSVGRCWLDEFLRVASGHPAVMSLCLAVSCLREPAALREIDALIREHRPKSVYLLLVDFSLGTNGEDDRAVLSFFRRLHESGTERIIYSHAPIWIYYLAPFGVTDFVSGANFLTTLTRKQLFREERIKGGITHNYYVPRRFCKMTTDQAREAVRRKVIEPCTCRACRGCRGHVPDDDGQKREHYLHVRLQECAELNGAADRLALLGEWATQTEAFLANVRSKNLRVTGDPNPTQWRSILAA